jgi:hypothetical protein
MYVAGISPGGAILLALLLVVVIVAVRWVLLRASGAGPPDVDFEWNPLSAASRAARAEQAGRYGEALLLYAQAGQGTRVLERMRSSLPDWPVRDTLLAATQELLELGQRALGPRAGIPEAVRDRLARYLENAGEVVWTTANRVAAAAALASAPPRGLQRESDTLERLLQAIRGARDSLADLTLAGGGTELQSVEQDFQRLSDVAKSLAAEDVSGEGNR